MEILATIVALEALKRFCPVTLYSDFRYLVDAAMKGWAPGWRANGWKRNCDEYAVNTDLWERLLAVREKHKVRFVWVQGHAGHPENERCDLLSVAAAQRLHLPADTEYEEQQASQGAEAKLFE
jgi:ribonuclease HI